MTTEFISKQTLKEKAEVFGVQLDETALDRFDTYAKMLVEWNEKINLTTITEPEDIVIKHFVDSISVLGTVDMPQGASFIDVGTGAGFPGLALLIARPDLKVTLLDGTKKRLMVLEDILENIGLSAIIVHARAEEAGRNPEYREMYDYSCARAVSNLASLSEFCLPFVKVDGTFISMKSQRADEELDDARKAIHVLGGKLESKNTFELDGAGERSIILIKKVSRLCDKYPRPATKISSKPIK
ncbi:MAG: 16S rRNA (guanine(527)-N(7))-methyltransferase RsmG [Clostridia bacterium]